MQETAIPSCIPALQFIWASYIKEKLSSTIASCLHDIIGGTCVSISKLAKTMVKHCVAAECSNTYKVSLYKFPQDSTIRQEWTRQVKRIRADWSGPSDHSILCSEHFTDDSFEPNYLLASDFGLEKTSKLKLGGIPTIFNWPQVVKLRKMKTIEDKCGSSNVDGMPATKRRRGAHEKRERARV